MYLSSIEQICTSVIVDGKEGGRERGNTGKQAVGGIFIVWLVVI